jgi:NDP-sugar pyrophosphorylase family protein
VKAIVFAAGEGTRLRPLTLDRPKPMLPVAGTPILGYLLSWLRNQGVSEVGINLHYRPEAITGYVGDGSAFGLRVRYSLEPKLLGSAGALVPLRSFLQGDEPVVAVYGDTLTILPLAPLAKWHRRSGSALTMAVMEHPRPTEAGIVELRSGIPWYGGVAGEVTRILEKPEPHQVFSSIASAGVFVFQPSVVASLPTGVVLDVARDLIPGLITSEVRVAAWRIPSEATTWDIGTLPSYERAQLEWPNIWRRWSPDPAWQGSGSS